ncbi:MAG: DUF1771 domain-containing protein [Actinomycetota bacterium]|nr:DUF1771 domain-containing protein [Actinomycetota bacterium]
MLRGELLQTLTDLKRYRDELRDEVRALEQRYNDLKSAYDPRIHDLRHRADSLASSFRGKFAEARAAYENDEKALAKALSLSGKELQAECERLNQEKDQLIAELKSALAELKTLRATLLRTNEALDSVRERLRTARSTRVEGFEQGDVIDALKIEEIMDALPQVGWRHVETVRREKRGPPGGLTEGLDQPGKPLRIRIGPSRLESVTERDERAYLVTTLAHEFAHVLHRRVLSRAQRDHWAALHHRNIRERRAFINDEASRGIQDDFAECYAVFSIRPRTLWEADVERYNFMYQLKEQLNEDPPSHRL